MQPGRLANRGHREVNVPALELYWNNDLIALLRQGIADDSGQDIVEYALLGAIIGIASVLTWKLVATTVHDVYGAANAEVQGVSKCTPDPVTRGGCP